MNTAVDVKSLDNLRKNLTFEMLNGKLSFYVNPKRNLLFEDSVEPESFVQKDLMFDGDKLSDEVSFLSVMDTEQVVNFVEVYEREGVSVKDVLTGKHYLVVGFADVDNLKGLKLCENLNFYVLILLD